MAKTQNRIFSKKNLIKPIARKGVGTALEAFFRKEKKHTHASQVIKTNLGQSSPQRSARQDHHAVFLQQKKLGLGVNFNGRRGGRGLDEGGWGGGR